MRSFSDLVLERLAAAGWYSGRVADTDADLEAIRDAGIEIPQFAEVFLREFSGLNPVQRPASGEYGEVRLLFDAEKALDDVGPEWIQHVYSPGLQIELTPVGLAENGYMLLMLDAEGILYGGWDQDVFEFGPLADGLHRLFSGERGDRIYTKS